MTERIDAGKIEELANRPAESLIVTQYELGEGYQEAVCLSVEERDGLIAALASEREHTAALTALISWIDGACVDELPHMEIRAAIERHRLRALLALHETHDLGFIVYAAELEEVDAYDYGLSTDYEWFRKERR